MATVSSVQSTVSWCWDTGSCWASVGPFWGPGWWMWVGEARRGRCTPPPSRRPERLLWMAEDLMQMCLQLIYTFISSCSSWWDLVVSLLFVPATSVALGARSHTCKVHLPEKVVVLFALICKKGSWKGTWCYGSSTVSFVPKHQAFNPTKRNVRCNYWSGASEL